MYSSGPRWPKDRLCRVMGSRCFPSCKSSRTSKLGCTYIDVVLQSLPPSYDPFIVNYNMNRLEKSIHELIKMLVQYEVMIHKSEPVVLVGEASTSKGARRWKRKKGKGTTVTATASTEGALPTSPKGKGKGKVGSSQRSKANDVCMYCQEKRHWKRECPQLLSNPNVCGPLSIPARGGFSYFITFIDDHSRYGYVYLMRYKSEAYGRFKEYRLEVEN
ncbi:UNVERIFIED_CONTAM: hypothetical protein Sradi_1536600 [Sesamum radiatum]|uniref:Gag/pol protein n=1 Tax=Sesamum radiatum TaxID=300843 RepID=A0AAW2U834_SESRA